MKQAANLPGFYRTVENTPNGPQIVMNDPRLQPRTITVEIPFVNTTGKFNFPNNNELNGRRIIGISIPENSDDNVLCNSGAVMIDNAAIAATFITIRRDSDNIIFEDYAKFYQETTGDRTMRRVNIDGFNPSTSFIECVDSSLYTVGEALMLHIEYVDC